MNTFPWTLRNFIFHFSYIDLVLFELEQEYENHYDVLKCILFVDMVDSWKLIIASLYTFCYELNI